MGTAVKQFWTLAAAMLAAVAVMAAAAFAQGTAYVPFVVNVGAKITAAQAGKTPVTLNVTGGVEGTLNLPLGSASSVLYTGGARGRFNAPVVTGSRGNITLRLPAQSYQNAEIALYSANGKRVLRGKAGTEQAGLSRQNVAAGVYMLSVMGVDGSAFTTRLAHSGGNLRITAAFGSENIPQEQRLAKSAAAGDWTITVSAVEKGYFDSAYVLNPVSGTGNPKQVITLRKEGQITIGSWTWEAFNDAPDGGTSSIAISQPSSAINISGTVTNAYEYGYVGLMAFPNATELAKLKTATSISFKVKGDGKTYRIMLPTSNVTDFSYYQATFTATAAEKTVTINIADFTQPTWGEPQVTLNKNLLDRIQWQTADGFKGAYNLTISELTLLGAPGVTYTVTFNVNGGTGTAPAAQSVSSGGTITLPSGSGLSKAGNTFGGWNTNASGTGTTYSAGASYTVTGTVTLYAKWNDAGGGATFTDSRDNKTYKKVQIGTQIWMAENLNYRNSTGSKDTVGVCYNYRADSCSKYGRLYDWSTAMGGASSSSSNPSGVRGVCPADWHLPSDAEWTQLTDFVGGESKAGTKLRRSQYWNSYQDVPAGTNEYGFEALPCGSGNSGGSFNDAGYSGRWWSATEDLAVNAWYRSMSYHDENVGRNYNYKYNQFSVRCVQDW